MNCFNVWKNKLDFINTIEDVKKNHEKVSKYINITYKNLNTIKTHYICLGKITENKKYKKIATKIQKRVENKKKLSKVEKEKWRPWSDLLLNINNYVYDLDNETENINHLITQLYTLHPPLRLLPWADMQVLEEKPDDETFNYLLLKNGRIYINNDKVSNSHGSQSFKLSKKLLEVIKKSLLHYPRKYLLQVGDTHISPNALGKRINKLFKSNIDLIRSAYITKEFDNNDLSLKEKENLMMKMRTGLKNALLNYNKVKYKTYGERHPEKIKEFARNYYNKNKEKILKRSYIRRITKEQKEPSKKMIDKYKLVYDEDTKTWK